ncbi:MAG: hypothetical protein GEV05_05335 [Betaproteobacteria bacterium]|nr:hypothetical protein [Betaproteobacteria bacterium]
MQPDVSLDTRATQEWLYQLWRAAGSNAEEARITAEHLVGANRAGHDSHGVSVVPGYVRSLARPSLTVGTVGIVRRISNCETLFASVVTLHD